MGPSGSGNSTQERSNADLAIDWTHLHHGVPAPKEEKLIVTGWISYA